MNGLFEKMLDLPKKNIKCAEIIINVHQNETGMFWTRLNIFIGIQFPVYWAYFPILRCCSKRRYIPIHHDLLCNAIYTSYSAFPERNNKCQNAVAHDLADWSEINRATEFCRADMDKIDRLPQYINFIVAAIIAMMFAFAWWIGIIHLEMSRYAINIPK